MRPLTLITIVIILCWVFIYTSTYAMWTWKQKNRLGAIMVFILAAASVALPVYSLFIKR